MSKLKIKLIATIFVVVAILGMLTGLIGYYSNWFTNWDNFNPKNWFGDNKDNTEQVQDNSGSILNLITNNGLTFVSDKIPFSKFSANGIDETADSAYELTAIIQPSIAENKNICWSARWNNVSSEWSHDKDISDYIIFSKLTTQSGENVIATFLNDFGEQILITASAEADNTKKAICLVDYRKRIKSLNYKFNYDNNEMENVTADTDGVFRFDFTEENKSYTIEPIPVYSDYTIDVTYSSVMNGKFTDTFGFGSSTTLNNLSLDSYISAPPAEPKLGEKATRFLGIVDDIFTNGVTFIRIDALKNYYKDIPDIEKTHSSIVRAYYAFSEANKKYPSVSNDSTCRLYRDYFIELYNNYDIPISYPTFMGIEITSLDTFLKNALACNNQNKGIIEYSVKYSSGDFVYDYKLVIGFTSSSLQAVRNVDIDNGEIII